ncbi:hypothetical protein LEP1GSC193_1369 [Leptospira alstonii serovar Pingchang str. 80-412]|uniref:Uncharacterized protein n=2 Tax=Leptospira alstonii TaxID=28452 RepID=M6CGR2_9LEPT|nr:hypothetical protein LEP1GSC194_1294 [Leptospira alstonii serovar Sichuan str. 79601]EQA81852.1 hypothetical protein LEP1GSC193_1369 [Leptospira alstonii serovar Pingchang str. 80-412]
MPLSKTKNAFIFYKLDEVVTRVNTGFSPINANRLKNMSDFCEWKAEIPI